MTETTAFQLMEWLDIDLIGKKVVTEPMGLYPGGVAKVTELRPDPEAPDIAFMVENEKWIAEDGSHEIGIFTYEKVSLWRE